jgi:hypothetical protein
MTEKTRADDWAALALRVQIASLLQEQAELLDEARQRMEAWTRRRRDAMQASRRTLCGRAEAEALAASYGDWLAASMDRVLSDMADARNQALRSAETMQRSLGSRVAAPVGAPPGAPADASHRAEALPGKGRRVGRPSGRLVHELAPGGDQHGHHHRP